MSSYGIEPLAVAAFGLFLALLFWFQQLIIKPCSALVECNIKQNPFEVFLPFKAFQCFE